MPGTSALLAAIFLWLEGKNATLIGTFFSDADDFLPVQRHHKRYIILIF